MKTVIVICLSITCLCNAVNILHMLKRIEDLEAKVLDLERSFIEVRCHRSIEDIVKEYTNEKVSDRQM